MSVVTNNISGGTTQQFYLFSCVDADCEKIWEKFMQLKTKDNVSNNIPAITAETPVPVNASPAVVNPVPRVETPAIIVPGNTAISVQKTFAPQSVRISEIVAIPGVNENEWVELFNATSEAIDLAQWKLIEGGGKQTELAGTIAPGEYLVFDKSSLNNDGDQITLKDFANNIIDEVSYGNWANSVAPVGRQGNSIVLANDKYAETTAITKGLANILTAPNIPVSKTPIVSEAVTSGAIVVQPTLPLPIAEPTSLVETQSAVVEPITETPTSIDKHVAKVFINEFLPNPKDGEEWIELYNDSEIEEDLFGYSLDDSPAGSAPYKIKTHRVIPAKGFLQLNASETKLALNNDGDQISLRDPSDNLISFTEYKQTKSGVSFSYFEDGWQETTIVTPGAPNVKPMIQVALATQSTVKKSISSAKSSSTKTDSYQVVALEDVKELPLTTKVKLRGPVIVLPKTFSDKYMYVDGLQIYFSKADWPAIEIGDELEVSGTVSESSGERRLVVKEKTDISVVEKKTPLIPGESSSLDLNEADLGKLVSLAGKLVEKKSSRLVFADADGEFSVQLNTKTTAKAGDYGVGSQLKIVGILKKYSDGYRLVPRGSEDLSFIEEAPVLTGSVINLAPNNTGKKVVFGLIGLAATLFCVNLYFLWQKRDDFKKLFSPVREFVMKLNHKTC
jgi:hypothetical protein